MRVLAVIDSTAGGGAETSLAAMAPRLIDRGIELDVAYFHDRGGVKESLIVAGASLLHVSHNGGRIATFRRLRNVMRDRRPDVVHTMVYEADILGRVAARSLAIPVISSIINDMYGPEQYERAPSAMKLRLAQLADIATARAVTRFHAISHTVAEAMAPRLRINPSDIDVIYRGRDPELFPLQTPERRSLARQQLGVSESTILIVAAARQEHQKGLDVLLESLPVVMSRYPDTRCLVAGRSGAASGSLVTSVRSLRLAENVEFMGHRQDVGDLLVAADVFVFPSRWEGLGGSVIEALAVGCPLVCSDLPVLREVLTTTGGRELARFVPPDRPFELARAILETIGPQDSPGPSSLERREHALQHFAIAAVVDQMAAFYRAVSTNFPTAV